MFIYATRVSLRKFV